MNITIAVPKGQYHRKAQIERELALARNIQKSEVRASIESGLLKILAAFGDGRAYLWNGTDLFVYAYPLNMFIYHCGGSFVAPAVSNTASRYLLVVMDANEVSMAMLVGKSIKPLWNKTSFVPRKHDAGGQCVSSDTLIFSDGKLIPILNLEKGVVSFNFGFANTENDRVLFKSTKEEEVYEVSTKWPRYKIKATIDHTFFISTEQGIIEKKLAELNRGDLLLISTEIPHKSEPIPLQTKPYYQRFKINNSGIEKIKGFISKEGGNKNAAATLGIHPITLGRIKNGKNHPFNIQFLEPTGVSYNECEPLSRNSAISFKQIPKILSTTYAEFLGYLTGDGSIDQFCIKFYDRDKENLNFYQKQFGGSIKFRRTCYEMKVSNSALVEQIKGEFPELKKHIPTKVMRASNDVLAGYLRGLYDAEGYVSGKGVSIAMNNENLIKEIQMLLLRFGILSSLGEYDCRAARWNKNLKFRCQNPKHRHSLRIYDSESLALFKDVIGFNAEKKKTALQNIALVNNRCVFVHGALVHKRISESKIPFKLFWRFCSTFHRNHRVRKDTLKKIIQKVGKDDIPLRDLLNYVYDAKVSVAPIAQIQKKGIEVVFDIETGNHNFVANGIIVHNSQRRFERGRAEALKQWLKEVGKKVSEVAR